LERALPASPDTTSSTIVWAAGPWGRCMADPKNAASIRQRSVPDRRNYPSPASPRMDG
jgi:hypothetical protein